MFVLCLKSNELNTVLHSKVYVHTFGFDSSSLLRELLLPPWLIPTGGGGGLMLSNASAITCMADLEVPYGGKRGKMNFLKLSSIFLVIHFNRLSTTSSAAIPFIDMVEHCEVGAFAQIQ